MNIFQLHRTRDPRVKSVRYRRLVEVGATPDNRVLRPTDTTSGDDFEGLALDAAWTPRNLGAGHVAFPNIVYKPALQLNFDASGDGVLRAVPASTTFEIVTGVRLLRALTNGGMVGPVILDATGAGVGFSTYNDNTTRMWNITAYAYASTGPSGSGCPTTHDYWLALRRNGDSYTGRWCAADGATWSAYSTAIAKAGWTPDRIGIMRLYTNSSPVFELSRFNVYFPTYA
jgi:hypothetical protein